MNARLHKNRTMPLFILWLIISYFLQLCKSGEHALAAGCIKVHGHFIVLGAFLDFFNRSCAELDMHDSVAGAVIGLLLDSAAGIAESFADAGKTGQAFCAFAPAW